jgi:hypothetical protein
MYKYVQSTSDVQKRMIKESPKAHIPRDMLIDALSADGT